MKKEEVTKHEISKKNYSKILAFINYEYIPSPPPPPPEVVEFLTSENLHISF
jgi:hypothetical protein